MSVVADQVFVEIPARRFERTLARRPLVERVRGGAFDGRFGGKRKFHAVLVMRSMHDVDWCTRFLAAEVVRRYADHHQSLVVIARIKLLQAGELRRVSAL